jgi:hypothetical protein
MATAREMPHQNLQPPQIDLVERFRRRLALLNPRCAGVGSLAAAPATALRWNLGTFLAEGGQDVLDAAHRDGKKDVSHRLSDLDDIEAKFGGDAFPRSRWCLMQFVAELVVHGILLKEIAVPDLNLLDPQIRAVLFMHYCPALGVGPFIPEKHECIEFFAGLCMEHAGLKIKDFRRFFLIIDCLYLECETTGGDGVQLRASKVARSQDERLVKAGLDPMMMNALFLEIVDVVIEESGAPKKVFAAGDAARAHVENHLHKLTLAPRLAHSQSLRHMATGARKMVNGTTSSKKSWPIPGNDLLNSSTAAAFMMMTAIAGGALTVATRRPNQASSSRATPASRPAQVVKFNLFWDIYNKDPEAIEEFRRRRKAKFATRHGKVKLGIQLKKGDPAALLTVLDANGVDVKGLDLVRGGARTRYFSQPAQITSFASHRSDYPATRPAHVLDTTPSTRALRTNFRTPRAVLL